LLLFHIFLSLFDYKIANLIALILTKIFAYIVNKLFVFKSVTKSALDTFTEALKFFLSRALTFFVDYGGLIIAVEIFSPDFALFSKKEKNHS
jgi:putative flippase GtrA